MHRRAFPYPIESVPEWESGSAAPALTDARHWERNREEIAETGLDSAPLAV
jgi:hypothetical protein